MLAIFRESTYPYGIRRIVEFKVDDSELIGELKNDKVYNNGVVKVEFFDGTVKQYNDSNS